MKRMVHFFWQDRPFELRRLVLRSASGGYFEATVRTLAERLGLAVEDDQTAARAGDLWLGSYPTPSAGLAADLVGWVSPIEVPLAVARLRGLAERLPTPPSGADVPFFTGGYLTGDERSETDCTRPEVRRRGSAAIRRGDPVRGSLR
jgi:hypothetical protein